MAVTGAIAEKACWEVHRGRNRKQRKWEVEIGRVGGATRKQERNIGMGRTE